MEVQQDKTENKATAVHTMRNGKQISLRHKTDTGKLREMLREVGPTILTLFYV